MGPSLPSLNFREGSFEALLAGSSSSMKLYPPPARAAPRLGGTKQGSHGEGRTVLTGIYVVVTDNSKVKV